jgi:hypothetical protein
LSCVDQHITEGRNFIFAPFFENAVPFNRYLVLTALCIALLLSGNVYGQEVATEGFPSVQGETKKGELSSGDTQTGSTVLLLPPGNLYAPYAADPERVDFGLELRNYTKCQIPDSGNNRFDLKAGGEFGLIRIHPHDHSDLGWQLSIEGGFDSQYDIDNHLDNIGWDGKYGLLLTTATTQNLSFKFGLLHDSSHVGDEYAQRTGRLRIGYTREELVAAISWLADNGWRTYAELGRGYFLGNPELQKPWRGQFGFEWQPAQHIQGDYRGWYGAGDFSSMEERDWRIDVSLQTGYRIDSYGKTWRFGIEWYSGRPNIGEFSQKTETYFALGFWIDI